jgi:phosphohistidine phosphatase
MELYILRHGLARDKEDWAPQDDRDRPLTGAGRSRTKDVANGLQDLGISFDRIITSPYRRALETAKIVSKVFDMKKQLERWSSLAVDGDPERLVRDLSRQKWRSVLLVGHEPYLSRLISVLVAGNTGMIMNLKKAGLVKISSEKLRYGRCASLDWLMPPKILTEL